MARFVLTVHGENPDTKKLLDYEFTNTSRALVLAEAVKFIALNYIVVFTAHISEQLTGSDLTSLVPNASPTGADAFLVLQNSSTLRYTGKRINEMSSEYALGVLAPGVIDVANSDITDAVALWKDEFGSTGYIATKGRYLD